MASLQERDTTVSQRQGNIPPEETMETDNQVRSDDPQFAKVLRTCLKMEIAACKEKLEANSTMIKNMRVKMRNEISRRKQLKEKVTLIHKVRVGMSESLTSKITDTLDAMKTNVDDQYKLMELRAQEYRDIIAEYKNTSDAYHAMYEEFPLAKTRKAAKIKLEELQIAHMVMTYKKTEMVTIIGQKRRIDWIRMRCKIIEFARVMVQRLKLEEKLTRLKVNVDYHRRQLWSIEMEMQMQRKRLEDQKRLRKQKMLEMAPPKINIPYWRMYVQAPTHAKVQYQRMQAADTFEDTISINTVVLEELCVNESTISPEVIDVESVQDKDPKGAVAQTESSSPKNFAVTENTDARAASVEPDIEANAAAEAASAKNDVEMKETYQEETHQPHKSAKTQPSSHTKGNLLKHNVAESTQDETEAKRMRLQREDSKGSSSNKINAGSSTVVRKDNAESVKSPTSGPKIRKIETVCYNTALLQKPVPGQNGAGSNVFSPPRYEYCESNMSFGQDSAKGPASLYDGSLCNYRLSPMSNMSIYFEKEGPTAPSMNILKQDDKNQSNKMSLFDFDNFTKKEKGNLTLF